MKPPPPMPHEYGSVTPSAAAVAIAASVALPPSLRTCIPTWEASWSTVATAPPVPVAVGCLGAATLGALEAGCTMPNTATRITIVSTRASELFMLLPSARLQRLSERRSKCKPVPKATHSSSHFPAQLQRQL